MRWLWIDRFEEFVSGSHASGIKNVSLDEEVVDEYCPGYPYLSPTLTIEGMAQMGGILVSEYHQFEKQCVLAKVNKATFHKIARTGDQLRYRVKVDSVHDTGATITSTSHIGDELHAEIDLMFAFLEEGRFTDGPMFGSGDLESMLRLMNFFHVAVKQDGSAVPIYECL